jgi:hypothetical protein
MQADSNQAPLSLSAGGFGDRSRSPEYADQRLGLLRLIAT